MIKLNNKQIALLGLLATYTDKNTHELATIRRDRQAFESNLRDRLFRLEKNGLVKSTSIVSTKNPNWTVKRFWAITDLGLQIYSLYT